MRYAFVLVVLLLFSQALAHEVQPPPRAESCAAMKWLDSERAKKYPMVDGFHYVELEVLANQAGDECEAYQAQAIDWADIEAEMAAAIERAAKKADERLSK